MRLSKIIDRVAHCIYLVELDGTDTPPHMLRNQLKNINDTFDDLLHEIEERDRIIFKLRQRDFFND